MQSAKDAAFELIEDYEYSAKGLLKSLIKALPENEVKSCLDYIMRVEDWPHKLDNENKVIKRYPKND